MAPEMVTCACAPMAVMASMAATARLMLELFIVFSFGFLVGVSKSLSYSIKNTSFRK
jgi:hypothetical protein